MQNSITRNLQTPKNKDLSGLALTEKKCAHCGKVFCKVDYNEYVYKQTVKGHIEYYCSYSCMQKAKKKIQ